MTEKTHIPGFLTKTFEIFSSPEYSDSCGWGANGDTIVIRKIEQFSKQVLPNYFKHSNFQSFVRQLNMYDFRKTVQDPNHGEFLHHNFKKGHPELLKLIKRKASSKHLVDHAANSGDHSAVAATTKKSSKSVKAAGSLASTGVGGALAGKQLSRQPSLDPHDVLLGGSYAEDGQNLLRLDSNTSVNSWASLDFQSGGLLDGSIGGGHGSGHSSNNQLLNSSNMNNNSNNNNANYLLEQGGGDLVRMNSLVSTALSQFGAPLDPLAGAAAKSQVMSETGALLAELHEQRVCREQYERTIESRLGHVEQENSMLKTLFYESHQKNLMMQERMDRLMKSLYNLLMGGPGVNQQQLLNDITNHVTSYNTNKLMLEDSRAVAGVGREMIRNLNNVGELSTYDITNLRRLPSLDLTGLSQPSADLYNSMLSAAATSSSASAASPAAASNSSGGPFNLPISNSSSGSTSAAGASGGSLVRMTSRDGMELSRQGNSFEIAASFVTAPNQGLRYVPSFDAAFVGADNRVVLEPLKVLNNNSSGGNNNTSSSSGSGSSSSSSYPMSDRVTFLSETTSSEAVESSAAKRRRLDSGLASPITTSAAAAVTASLSSSSLSAAAAELLPLGPADASLIDEQARDFLEKLNKNQEVTLQRLDSLENTLSSLFESSSSGGVGSGTINNIPGAAAGDNNLSTGTAGAEGEGTSA